MVLDDRANSRYDIATLISGLSKEGGDFGVQLAVGIMMSGISCIVDWTDN